MKIRLQRVVLGGIYGSPRHLPERMRLLEPEAASALARFERLYGVPTASDCYRSPEASLVARRTKRGVQPPGYSAHNFGLAIDVAVSQTCVDMGVCYEELCVRFAAFGWYCHRRDGRRGFEDWHFNYLGVDSRHLGLAERTKARTWGQVVEAKIQDLYGPQMVLSLLQVQEGLKALRLYGGPVDGHMRAQTAEAIKVFQRAWSLEPDGVPGTKTQRVLAVVAAEHEITEL